VPDQPCDVCFAVDGDRTPKATARWCGRCRKWICDRCRYSPRRVQAVAHAVRRTLRDYVSKREVSP